MLLKDCVNHQMIFLLCRDICVAFGKTWGPDLYRGFESKQPIHELLTEGRRSKTNKTKSLAIWGTKEIRKLKPKA